VLTVVVVVLLLLVVLLVLLVLEALAACVRDARRYEVGIKPGNPPPMLPHPHPLAVPTRIGSRQCWPR